MTAPPRPQLVVPTDHLDQYPISREDRLDAHSFMKWWHLRWMASRSFKLASWEAQGMMLALFTYAQTESPIGTLPDDDAELAVMLRVDSRKVPDLRRQEFGPFRGWRRCLSGTEVRLMHPVVLEQVEDALERREVRAMSQQDQAERKRIERVRKGLAMIGCKPAVLEDAVLMGRINEWLTANWRSRRSPAAYERALQEALKLGWIGPPA